MPFLYADLVARAVRDFIAPAVIAAENTPKTLQTTAQSWCRDFRQLNRKRRRLFCTDWRRDALNLTLRTSLHVEARLGDSHAKAARLHARGTVGRYRDHRNPDCDPPADALACTRPGERGQVHVQPAAAAPLRESVLDGEQRLRAAVQHDA